MKDRILNFCMLVTVALALGLSLTKSGPKAEPSVLTLTAAPARTVAPTASPSPAQAYRPQREQTRREEREALQSLIRNDGTAAELRAAAEQQLLDMTRNAEIELLIEGALAAQGWNEGLCAVRQGTVTVFLPRQISEQEAAFLSDLIMEAADIAPENIRLTGFSF